MRLGLDQAFDRYGRREQKIFRLIEAGEIHFVGTDGLFEAFIGDLQHFNG